MPGGHADYQSRALGLLAAADQIRLQVRCSRTHQAHFTKGCWADVAEYEYLGDVARSVVALKATLFLHARLRTIVAASTEKPTVPVTRA